MKNYNEMASDVLRRIGEYETEQRKKRKILNRVIIPVCSACFVALMGIGLWQADFWRNKPPIDLEDSTVIGEKDWVDDKGAKGENSQIDGDYSPNGEAQSNDSNTSAISQNSETTDNSQIDDDYTSNGAVSSNTSTVSATSQSSETTDDAEKSLFYLNKIENTAGAKFKYLDPSEHYEEIWDVDKTGQYLGVYLNNIRHNGLSYQGDGTQTVTYSKNGELVRAIMSFSYSFKDTEVNVRASKIGYPYDCLYSLDENKESRLKVGDGYYNVLFAGKSSENNPEIMALLVADFQNNGVKYRVKAENISHYDFYKIVVSVITG